MADKDYPACLGCESQLLLIFEELCFLPEVKLAAPQHLLGSTARFLKSSRVVGATVAFIISSDNRCESSPKMMFLIKKNGTLALESRPWASAEGPKTRKTPSLSVFNFLAGYSHVKSQHKNVNISNSWGTNQSCFKEKFGELDNHDVCCLLLFESVLCLSLSTFPSPLPSFLPPDSTVLLYQSASPCLEGDERNWFEICSAFCVHPVQTIVFENACAI